MTIPATSRRSPVYVVNGVATAYAFGFKTADAATVVVTLADADDLNPVELTNGVDFTVALNPDQDASPGGTVTFAGGTVGQRLVITSATEYEQTLAISNQGAFHARVLEDALDRIVVQVQQLHDDVGRTVKLPPTSEGDPSTILQDSIDLAANSATAAAASAAAASASETAAASSASAAATSATNASNSAASASANAIDANNNRIAAQDSASSAATSATNAANSASAAATSATNAGNSATAAAGSASSAATQATNAANSASSAATSATNASNSAAAAAASAASIDPATLVKRDGSQGMTAQLPVVAGSAATPSFAPSTDTNTGPYWPAADQWAVSVGGANVITVEPGKMSIERSAGNAELVLNSVGGSGRPYSVSSNTDGSWTVYDVTTATNRLRLGSTGTLQVGNATINETASIYAGLHATSKHSVNLASGAAGVIFTLPIVDSGTWLVTLYVDASDPANYQHVVLLTSQGATVRATTFISAASMAMTLSGRDVQVSQSSGVTQLVQATVTRLG